jgi:hypothetical protein
VSQLDVQERNKTIMTPIAPPEGSVIAHSPRAELSVGPQPVIENSEANPQPTLEPTREVILEPTHQVEPEPETAKAPDA